MIIYRGIYELLSLEIDNNTQLKQELQGEDVVQSNFTLEHYYEFKIGDYINWRGKKYTIFKQPSVKKIQTNQIQYNLEFGSDIYRLLNAVYLLDSQGEFFLLGDLQKFANLLVVNLNRLAGESFYQLGTVPATDVKNLNFSNSNCLLVLQQIASEFGKEFEFSTDGTTINFVDKIGVDTALVFQFKQGLRHIERQKISDTSLVTRLYAFGGERNITNDYGSKRLKINPIEQNTGLFGAIEGVVTFDDIYPHREGTITSLGPDEFIFIDSGIDFNLNDQLMPGVKAKVTFNTGDLAGYDFEILNYNSSLKQFEIISYEDENGLVLPNATLKPNIGDEYVLHDIIMPQIYINNAEAELLVKATEYINLNSKPNVIYSILPHPPYLRENLIQLNVGDLVTVKDDDFEIEYQTRILNITQSLSNPYIYSIKVGDKLTVNYITKVLGGLGELDDNITIERYDRTVHYNRIRRNLRNIDELRDSVFDPDGYFDTGNIRPLSIETNMLTVGSKSQQFLIRELLIEANYQSDPNKTNIGNGVLVHFQIEDTIKEWSLTGAVKTHADLNQYYYIYARCNRSGTTGDFLSTSIQYKVDTGSTYYYFLIGVIHSAQNGVRGISLTYGQTTINGKFITTGRVQSVDGINYFDLDTGQFFIGDSNSSLDWNVTNPNKLTIKGSVIQTSAGVPINITNYRGLFNIGTTYNEGDTFTYNGVVYHTLSTIVGTAPPNPTYYELYVDKGEDGADGLDGAQGPQGIQGVDGADGQPTYTWIRYADDVNGTGITNDPTGKTFIGFAYNKTSPLESNTPGDYTWALLSGEGVPGPAGADGQTTYTWVKYSDSADGTGLYDIPTASTLYIGIAVNKTTATESTDKTDYTWSKFKGDNGADGADGVDGVNGSDGQTGPSIVFRGLFSASEVYYNNDKRRDVVKYTDDVYYIYNGTDGVALAWSASNWESFGAQFESVATNTLLSENANIADWIIQNGKITSQAEYNGSPRAQLDGTNGKLTLISPITTYTGSGGTRTYEHTLELDSANGRIEARHTGDSFQNSGVSYVDSEGVFANFAGTQALPASSGIEIKGSVVGLGNGKLDRTAYSSNNAICGVVGMASNSSSDPAPSYGGLFFGLKSYGFFINVKTITGSSHYVSGSEDYISCYNTGTTNIYLPTSNRYIGRVIYIKRINGGVLIQGNGIDLLTTTNVSSISINDGRLAILVYDGTYWCANVILTV
ncbi:phage tail protein [Changchengzhania lutea]|uniref:phage tail protein n=1 Tax=Changchengzhania lutea TaxID=2049305 RepID=UPI00115C82D6|nr:phage tail protein [Changchengzhania lutea]